MTDEKLSLCECPFCGSEPHPVYHKHGYTWCNNDECVLHDMGIWSDDWNNRATTEAERQIEAIRAVVQSADVKTALIEKSKRSWRKAMDECREALLPCPFCGESPILKNLDDADGGMKIYVCPETSSCAESKMFTAFLGNEDDAIAAWTRRAPSGWLPIETAPKDDITIMLYRPSALVWGKVTPGKWNDDKYAQKPRPFWEMWFKIGTITESRQWEPTHWMPLPAPPKEG